MIKVVPAAALDGSSLVIDIAKDALTSKTIINENIITFFILATHCP